MRKSNPQRKAQHVFKNLADAICALSCAVKEMTAQRKDEFDWIQAHHGLATKHDLEQTEKRLTDAIEKNASITPAIEKAAMKAQSALDKLDASIPDKKEVKL